MQSAGTMAVQATLEPKRIWASLLCRTGKCHVGVPLACLTEVLHVLPLQVAEEILAYEVIHVLLADITDDTIEIAVNMLKQCGAHLEDTSRPFMIAYAHPCCFRMPLALLLTLPSSIQEAWVCSAALLACGSCWGLITRRHNLS